MVLLSLLPSVTDRPHEPAGRCRRSRSDALGSAGLALQGVQVQGRLDGLLLRTTIQQRYRNRTGRLIETVYTFRWLMGRACWACR